MGRNFALLQPQAVEAESMYLAGKPLATVAAVFGVSRAAVANALRHRGVVIRTAGDSLATAWSIEEFRLRAVITANECWEWQGALKPNGYGYINKRGRTVYVHRLAAELAGLQLRKGSDVCHSCDNRRCCNPEHLFIGTRLQNMRDAMSKGRLSCGVLHGLAVKRGRAAKAAV